MNIPSYIGETSRPARERISEHIMRAWSKKSVILQHWMEHHGTEVVSPQFKFELIGAYNDPLRRQLTEALQIVEQGTINSIQEFGVNELFQLQCTTSSLEQDTPLRVELEKRQCNRVKLQSFIDVISNILTCNTRKRMVPVSRLNKRLSEDIQSIHKRCKMMNTSTLKNMGSYRNTKLIPDDSSPVDVINLENETGMTEGSSVRRDDDFSKKQTNLSGIMDANNTCESTNRE